MFGEHKSRTAASVFRETEAEDIAPETPPNTEPVPPERRGLHGECDQSSLAKRAALALDEDPDIDDIETVYIAQAENTVVLKGQVPSQDILQRLVSVANQVDGATDVDTSQVTVG